MLQQVFLLVILTCQWSTTAEPTAFPTLEPSAFPSSDPTIDPTIDPTAYPTTVYPTELPTDLPTMEPTTHTTHEPTWGIDWGSTSSTTTTTASSIDDFKFIAHISAFSGIVAGFATSTKPLCTASVVQMEFPAVFMTAASCFNNVSWWDAFISFEPVPLVLSMNLTDNFTLIPIVSLSVYPDFDNMTNANDIALIFTPISLINRTDVESVTLPQNATAPRLHRLERVSYAVDDDAFGQIVSVKQEYYDNADCIATTNNSFGYFGVELSGQICAMPKNLLHYKCLYDNDGNIVPGIIGSALMEIGSLEQVGIFSSEGLFCDWTVPSLYTNVALYTWWIQMELEWVNGLTFNTTAYNISNAFNTTDSGDEMMTTVDEMMWTTDDHASSTLSPPTSTSLYTTTQSATTEDVMATESTKTLTTFDVSSVIVSDDEDDDAPGGKGGHDDDDHDNLSGAEPENVFLTAIIALVLVQQSFDVVLTTLWCL